MRKGPKPKYHTSMTGRGVTAGTPPPRFDPSSENDSSSNDDLSNDELASSDLDTDFSADEKTLLSTSKTPMTSTSAAASKRTSKLTPKVAALKEMDKQLTSADEMASTPTLKLKIKLPSTSSMPTEAETPKSRNAAKSDGKRSKMKKSKETKTPKSSKKSFHYGFADYGPPGRKKSTDTWSSNRRGDSSTSESDDNLVMDADEGSVAYGDGEPHEPTASDKLYCVCQCPHDDVSEMIGCDAPDCRLEWFHFECVGIMVPPKGQWFCPECSDRYNIKNRNYW